MMYPKKNSWARTVAIHIIYMYLYAIVCYYWSRGIESRNHCLPCGNGYAKKNDGVGFSFTKRTFLADYLPLILVQAELGLAGLACLARVRKRAVQDRWITDSIRRRDLFGWLCLAFFFSERSKVLDS
ncbi:hypothetical protein F5B19DRAFT_466557 [Rostrohypoxylon terebratum]|nr:hypothetical protein F5B19DRAFT_466557 [Rostrohypoxylon terebratum]